MPLAAACARLAPAMANGWPIPRCWIWPAAAIAALAPAQTPPQRSSVTVPTALRSIEIDGDLADWAPPTHPGIQIGRAEQVLAGAVWSGPDDAALDLRLAY